MKVTNDQDETSLGFILQQAREQRGLTQAQAATQLNLKIAVIAQMEAEQWDQSVAPTFMRGYLRSYARLLKLSETEILQAFAVQTAYLRHHPKEMKSFSNKTRRDAAENRFMLATYFVVVLLIGLFLASVWQTHMVDDKPVSVLPEYIESSELPVSQITAEQTSSNQAPVPTTANNALNASAQPPVDVTPASDNTVQSQADGAALLATPAAEPSLTAASPTATAQSLTQPEAANQVAERQATVAQNLAAQEKAATAAINAPTNNSSEVVNDESEVTEQVSTSDNSSLSARGTLTLQFSKGCWVSVEDSTGKRLTYQMYQAGQEAKISGVYPLKVTLGEPTAVTMQLNDVSIDLAQYKTGRVARLTFNGPA